MPTLAIAAQRRVAMRTYYAIKRVEIEGIIRYKGSRPATRGFLPQKDIYDAYLYREKEIAENDMRKFERMNTLQLFQYSVVKIKMRLQW